MFLARVELVQLVLRLQFTKRQLYLPSTPIQRRYISWLKLLSRQIRDVEVVVAGVLVTDADDVKPFAVCPSLSDSRRDALSTRLSTTATL